METHDLEYFKFIRQEILDRIKIHYYALILKFTVTGGLLSFLLTYGKDIPVSPFLLGSLLACLFDVLLLENLGWIRAAGSFVKWEVEDASFQIRWEHDFAQHGNRWQCFHPLAYLIGVWSVDFFLWLGFVTIDFRRSSGVDIVLLVVSVVSLAYSLVLVFHHLRYPTLASLRSWKCRRRLRAIRDACVDYAAKHDGTFPPTWGGLGAAVESEGYTLAGSRTEQNPRETVLAYCTDCRRKWKGANVLFVDGCVSWHDSRRLNKLLGIAQVDPGAGRPAKRKPSHGATKKPGPSGRPRKKRAKP